MIELIHTYCFHLLLFFFSARKAVKRFVSGETRGGGRFHPAPWNGWVFPLSLIRGHRFTSEARNGTERFDSMDEKYLKRSYFQMFHLYPIPPGHGQFPFSTMPKIKIYLTHRCAENAMRRR